MRSSAFFFSWHSQFPLPLTGSVINKKLFSGSAASGKITWPLTSHRGFNMSWPRGDVHMAADWSVDCVSRGSVQRGQENLKWGLLSQGLSVVYDAVWRASVVTLRHHVMRGTGIFVPGWRCQCSQGAGKMSVWYSGTKTGSVARAT